MQIETIGIVGGGAWGTALAQTVCQAGRGAMIWALEPETVDAINQDKGNPVFLPDIALDPAIRATGDLAVVAKSNALLLVTPVQHTRRILEQRAPHVADGTPVLICAKGLEQSTGKLLSDVLTEAMPQAVQAILSGPSFAAEVARGLPAAVTLACADQTAGRALQSAIGHRSFRTYLSDDVTGAQIGGAIKNVLAIAAGIVDGKALGSNAHAALTARGFVELVRFGTSFGARTETLSGLSGLGDLILTCSSRQSRNMSLGHALGQGQTLNEILGARKSVSEGVHTASAVAAIATERGLDMPISLAVHGIVSGAITVDTAIEGLLARPFTSEI